MLGVRYGEWKEVVKIFPEQRFADTKEFRDGKDSKCKTKQSLITRENETKATARLCLCFTIESQNSFFFAVAASLPL